MNPVSISKSETCLSYALKRGGYNIDIDDIADIDQLDLQDYISYDKNELQSGDLLVWTYKERRAFLPTEITKEGHLIFHNVMMNRHMAIYKGNGMISDCHRTLVEGSVTPSLRIRRLTEIPTRPEWIITRKSLIDIKTA